MIGTKFTIENENGKSIVINDHSVDDAVIALQDYPEFKAGVKQNEVQKEGQHGIWDFSSYYDKMMINFSGVIVGDTQKEVEEKKRELSSIVALPTQPTTDSQGLVTIKWTDESGNNWQIKAKLHNSINYSRRIKRRYKLDFNMSLKAPKPFIVSQEEFEETGIRAVYTTGAQFPIKLPASLKTEAANTLILNNEGAIGTETIITLYGTDEGTITNPTVENITNGKEFSLSITLDGADEYVEIDSEKGTVIDHNGDDVSGNIDSSSEFITLVGGENELAYLADEMDRTPDAEWSVKYRNRTI